MKLDDRDPADLVIGGEPATGLLHRTPTEIALSLADTVVIFPPEKDTVDGGIAHGETSEVLEKPLSKQDQVSCIYRASRTLNLWAEDADTALDVRAGVRGRYRCHNRYVVPARRTYAQVFPSSLPITRGTRLQARVGLSATSSDMQR